MTLPVEPTRPSTPPKGEEQKTGNGDGDQKAPQLKCGITVLDPYVYRDTRWCAKCGGAQLFIEVFEIAQGRIGVCMGCGDERFVPFSRTNGEAA